MRTPIRTVGAFGGSTEPAVLPGRTCLTYGRLRDVPVRTSPKLAITGSRPRA